jgi:hypothetical protein
MGCWRPGTGGYTQCLGDHRLPGAPCRLGREGRLGTHHRTDIMARLSGSPWKVLLVAVVLVVAVVLIALFGSKKLPDNG